jgi:transcriptional regulator with GAF, ATPase, and Fis domain
VIPVQVPPLRDPQEDIPLLVAHFIDKFRGEQRWQSPSRRRRCGG